MDGYIQIATIKKKDGHILWFQGRFPVTNIHADPVKQVITVRLDYQLAAICCNLAE